MAITEFGDHVNAPYMNGYEGGEYNISITAFDVDDGDVGLFMYKNDKKWQEVFNKKKEGDPAKKFQATRPFAIEQDSLYGIVQHEKSFVNSENELKSFRNPQKQLEAWETENERLKLEVEYLQKVVQIHKQGNRDYTLDKNSLKSQALDLMKSNNAKGDASELAAIMDELYRYFATDENWQWDELQEKAGKAADWLMEHQKHRLEDYAQSALDWMAKRYVRLNDPQLGEIQYQFGSLSEFKKAVWRGHQDHANGIYPTAVGI